MPPEIDSILSQVLIILWHSYSNISLCFLGSDFWNLQHGCTLEAPCHLHLWEQQIWHGHVCGASRCQYRLLQERRLHSRPPGNISICCWGSSSYDMIPCAICLFYHTLVMQLRKNLGWPGGHFGENMGVEFVFRWMEWIFCVSGKPPDWLLNTADRARWLWIFDFVRKAKNK